MNRTRRWQTVQQSALLFVLALGGWLAFQCVSHTSFAVIPGLITAVLLAAAGTSVLRYLDENREVRLVQPALGRQAWTGPQRVVTAPAPSPIRHRHRHAA